MNSDTNFPSRTNKVTFLAPEWDQAETDANADNIGKMKAYVLKAVTYGLDSQDIAEDLNYKFGKLGRITVERIPQMSGVTHRIEVEATAEA